jgi:hypothetical protein
LQVPLAGSAADAFKKLFLADIRPKTFSRLSPAFFGYCPLQVILILVLLQINKELKTCKETMTNHQTMNVTNCKT